MNITTNKNCGLNYKFEYLENANNSSFTSNIERFAQTEESISCGEIILLKNAWRVQFQCVYCRKGIQNLELFLQHSLEHIYEINVDDAKNQKVAKYLTINATEQQTERSLNLECLDWLSPVPDPLATIKKEEIHIVDTCDNDDQLENATLVQQDSHADERLPCAEYKTDALLQNTAAHIECKQNEEFSGKVADDNTFPINNLQTACVGERSAALADTNIKKRRGKGKLKKEKQFICPICNKQFILKHRLSAHMLRHSSDKPHKCDMCDAYFKDRSNLNAHRKRHLRIRPHQCELCDKRFPSTTELKTHYRWHTGEKPYVCEQCGAAYATTSHLAKHKRGHAAVRPHGCEECGMKFYDKSELNKHKKIHTLERPFQCVSCSASFKTKNGLQQHLKLHQNLFEYKCTYCDKAFKQNAGLHSHIKSVHGSLK